jgi:hypothetical protein
MYLTETAHQTYLAMKLFAAIKMFMIEARNVFKINPIYVNINTASFNFSFQFEMNIETD